MALIEALSDEAKKKNVVRDCCDLIDAEVKDKGGISGLAIKAGYGAVKGVKPGFVKTVVTDLLPEFATALDPISQEAKSSGGKFGDFFASHADRVAAALLAITNAKAQKSKNRFV